MNAQATADNLLLAPLRALLSRTVSESTPARELCAELDGRVLSMRVRGTGLCLSLVVESGELLPVWGPRDDADVIVEGSPLALAAMGTTDPDAPVAGRIDIGGDAEAAQKFRELLGHAAPDWERELSRIVGGITAHQIGNVFRSAAELGRQAFENLTRSASEFAREETRDVVSEPELAAFAERVGELVADVDALEARIDRHLSDK